MTKERREDVKGICYTLALLAVLMLANVAVINL